MQNYIKFVASHRNQERRDEVVMWTSQRILVEERSNKLPLTWICFGYAMAVLWVVPANIV